ncbi:MAG: hypothetical protein ACD_47C00029G0001 [uncultured bacterium]|nr:MAG: hypothetical protein ACD_47C00029G0001 [uncultured bacterium]
MPSVLSIVALFAVLLTKPPVIRSSKSTLNLLLVVISKVSSSFHGTSKVSALVYTSRLGNLVLGAWASTLKSVMIASGFNERTSGI